MTERPQIIKLLLTGGGTGGHLFPAVATAQAFQQKAPDTEVLFIGTRRKVDTRSLAAYGFASRTIVSFGLKGKRLPALLKALAVLPVSYLQARKIIREFQPDILLGVGGYVTGPVILAAKHLGIPVVIHEQNSIPGLANRKIARFADKICLSLPGSGNMFPENKIVYTGNPVRRAILELAAVERCGGRMVQTLVILGGSQGAVGVNRLVMDAVASLRTEELQNMRIIHQTGEADFAKVKEFYANKECQAEVQPFFSAMNEVYRDADLLISRAGATTLSEIAVLGLPAILIPYPFAADNHQEKNAGYYVDGGGAECYPEKELSGQELADHLRRLLAEPAALEKMSLAMKRLSYPAAAENIVACCLDVMRR